MLPENLTAEVAVEVPPAERNSWCAAAAAAAAFESMLANVLSLNASNMATCLFFNISKSDVSFVDKILMIDLKILKS